MNKQQKTAEAKREAAAERQALLFDMEVYKEHMGKYPTLTPETFKPKKCYE